MIDEQNEIQVFLNERNFKLVRFIAKHGNAGASKIALKKWLGVKTRSAVDYIVGTINKDREILSKTTRTENSKSMNFYSVKPNVEIKYD